MLRCALTGQIVKNPVATPRGLVYERSAIESFLKTHNFDPIDTQPLSIDDLILMQIDLKPSHSSTLLNPSFGSLIHGVANEYEANQKEILSLQNQIHQTEIALENVKRKNEAAYHVIHNLQEKNNNGH